MHCLIIHKITLKPLHAKFTSNKLFLQVHAKAFIIIMLLELGNMTHIHTHKRRTWQTDRQYVQKRGKKQYKMYNKHNKLLKMQTDTHIEVVPPYHCYDCSRHTGRTFYNLLRITVSNDGKPYASNISVTL